jgi:hypothetical protein
MIITLLLLSVFQKKAFGSSRAISHGQVVTDKGTMAASNLEAM